MDRLHYNAFDRVNQSKKQDSSARSRHVFVQQPDNNVALGTEHAEEGESATPTELPKREASLERDSRPQSSNPANPERFTAEMRPDVSQKEYDQHKQDINNKLSQLEKECNKLKRQDQQLEKRFKNLSWFKSALGIDSKRKFAKCEYQLKQSREKLSDAIRYVENTIQGNPRFYAVVSVKDMIRLYAQDQKQFQERIDLIKMREPQSGDITPRQKHFVKQETSRDKAQEYQRVKDIKMYKKKIKKEIANIKNDTKLGIEKNKKHIEIAIKTKDSNRVFQAAEQVSNRVSFHKKRIESMQRQVQNFPELLDKCKKIAGELKEYRKQLDATMKKEFGERWTLRYIRVR